MRIPAYSSPLAMTELFTITKHLELERLQLQGDLTLLKSSQRSEWGAEHVIDTKNLPNTHPLPLTTHHKTGPWNEGNAPGTSNPLLQGRAAETEQNCISNRAVPLCTHLKDRALGLCFSEWG